MNETCNICVDEKRSCRQEGLHRNVTMDGVDFYVPNDTVKRCAEETRLRLTMLQDPANQMVFIS